MSEKASCSQRIREGLSARGMSQSDLCRLTGIGKSAMSQYANGGLVPRQDRTMLIARALNVSEAWLMGFDVPMERSALVTPEGSERIREFTEIFGKLTDEQQSLIISQIKGILSNR